LGREGVRKTPGVKFKLATITEHTTSLL
jgi:hypothetical protein